MRVIAGSAKGHNLKTEKGISVRPTTDKVKGSIFSMLSATVYDAKVLDLFSGSGALGIEALSRGAKSCVFTDCSANSVNCINENLAHTKLTEKATVIKTDAFSFLKERSSPFDIIFLDPPYNMGLAKKAIELILEKNLLAFSGIISVETDHDELLNVDFPGLLCIKEKRYGRISLKFYKKY